MPQSIDTLRAQSPPNTGSTLQYRYRYLPRRCLRQHNAKVFSSQVELTTRTTSGPPSTGAAIAMDGDIADTSSSLFNTTRAQPPPKASFCSRSTQRAHREQSAAATRGSSTSTETGTVQLYRCSARRTRSSWRSRVYSHDTFPRAKPHDARTRTRAFATSCMQNFCRIFLFTVIVVASVESKRREIGSERRDWDSQTLAERHGQETCA